MNKILNDAEAAELQKQGLQVQAGDIVELDDSAPQGPQQGGAGRAAYHNFAASALPAAGGGVGMASGMALGAVLAPETGGLSLAIPLLLGAAGGYGGAKAGSAVTEAILSPEEQAQLQQDQIQHPTASTIGGLASLPLGGMMPTPTGVANTLSGVGKLGAVGLGKLAGLERAGASTAPILNNAERLALQNSAMGAILNPVQEAATAGLEGRDITAKGLLESALIGATFNSPTPGIGKRMGFHDYQPGQLENPDTFRATFTPGEEPPAQPQEQFRPTRAPIRLSPQDQIAEEVGLNLKAKSAQESANRMALAGEEVTPRTAPEIEERVQSLEDKKQSQLLKKAIPAPQQELVFEIAPAIKQEIAKLPPEAYSERWKQLEPHLKGLGLTDKSMAVLQDEVFGPKGLTLKAGEVEGGNIGKWNPLKPDELVVDQQKAGIIIPAHEGFHEQWSKMTPEEQARWAESSAGEMAKINEARATAGRKPYDPEEYFATQGSAKFAEQGLNTNQEGGFKKWWEDTKSQFKARFGKEPTVDELLRAANLRLMNEKRSGKTMPWVGGEVKNASEDENLKAEYEQLQAFLKSKDVPFQDKMKAFARIEQIKNSFKGDNYGMPPDKKSGETVKFASEEENTAREQALNRRGWPKDVESQASRLEPTDKTRARQKALELELLNQAREADGLPPISKYASPDENTHEINPKTGKPYSPRQARNRAADRAAFGEIPDRTNAAFKERGVDNVHTPITERQPFIDREQNATPDWSPEEKDTIDRTVNRTIFRTLARKGLSKLPSNIKRSDVRDYVLNDIKENGLDVDEHGNGRLAFTAMRRADAYVQRELPNEFKTEQATKTPIEENRKPVGGDEAETVEEPVGQEEAPVQKTEPTEVATRETVKQKKAVSKAEAGISRTTSAADLYDRLAPMEGRDPRIDAILDDLSERSPGEMVDMDELMAKHGLEEKHASDEENLGERKSFVRSMAPTFDKVEPLNPKLAEAFRSWEVSRDMYVGKANAAIKDLHKFSDADINRVATARREAFRTDEDYTPAPGKDTQINDILKRYYHDTIGQERRRLGVEINGREAGLNPNYQPDQLSAEAIDTLVNKPNSVEGKYLKRKWVEHIIEKAAGAVYGKEAKDYVDSYVGALGGDDSNYLSVKFGAIRKAEGYGLPDEIREKDATTSLMRYSRRAASDLAMFKELESKPEIAAALALKDNETGKTVEMEGVEDLSNVKEIQNAMKWVTGNFSGGTFARVNPRSAAVVRLVNNMLLGPATAIRDTASIPVNMLPYIQKFGDLSSALTGIQKIRENSRRALEAGAVQPNLDRRQFNDILNAPDAATEFIRKAASFARLAQGREHIENFNRELTFSIGRELAKQKVIGAKGGDKKSKEWLSKFDTAVEGDLLKLRGSELEDALDVVAKNFTDRNQGTYGGRGLPVGIVDSQFAPFFALQKWSVEKANTIYQDVIQPAVEGKDYVPMLSYTLGSVLTGAAIQQLNKLLSGRKSQDPEVGEVLDKGHIQDYVAQLATLMQLGSYAGIVGDGLKAMTDVGVYGKTPRNVVSFPTSTAALDMASKLTDVSEALKQGENPFDVLKAFSLDVLTHNIQAARMVANRTVKGDDIERADKFRDLRTFNMLEGKPNQDFTPANPYLGLDSREFKRSDDFDELPRLANETISRKISDAGDNFDQLRSGLGGLKQMSFNTMPSLKQMPQTFMRYYEFLKDTQGQSVADERMAEFLRMQAINSIKSGIVPKL